MLIVGCLVALGCVLSSLERDGLAVGIWAAAAGGMILL